MDSIKDRLAALRQQHKQSAPSFLPTRRKKAEVVLPDAAELVTDKADLDTLRELVALHVQYSGEERKAKAQKAPVADSIKSVCQDYGLTKITCDGNKVTYYPTKRSTISRQLLLDKGVSLKTINDCTVTSDSYGVRVTPPGSDDEDDPEAN